MSDEVVYFVRKVAGGYRLESCGGLSRMNIFATSLDELTTKATSQVYNKLTLEKIREAIDNAKE